VRETPRGYQNGHPSLPVMLERRCLPALLSSSNNFEIGSSTPNGHAMTVVIAEVVPGTSCKRTRKAKSMWYSRQLVDSSVQSRLNSTSVTRRA
jgi:hypothetical protein